MRGPPDPFAGQFPHDVEGLVSLLRLQAIDRQDDLLDGMVVQSQGLGVLLTGREHRLVSLDVSGDGIFGEPDPVGVDQFGADQGDRPVASTASMSDPAEDIPADGPVRGCDGGFEFGALGPGVPGAVRIGAMVELAEQFDGPVQGMNPAVSVIADVHHPATAGASAIEDVEFPEREVGILRPVVGHLDDVSVHGPKCGFLLNNAEREPARNPGFHRVEWHLILYTVVMVRPGIGMQIHHKDYDVVQ